jgi:hypothetical protein
MKMRLDMDKIARGLGAERRGKVAASGGYFGAIQLLATHINAGMLSDDEITMLRPVSALHGVDA